MLQRFETQDPLDTLEAAVTTEDVVGCQQAVRQVRVDEKISRYVVEIMRATRDRYDVALGGGPRFDGIVTVCAVVCRHPWIWFCAAGRYRQVLPYVLGHRLILRPESRLRKKNVAAVLNEIMDSVTVPTVNAAGL